jgi:hypothetical protein
VNIEVVGIRTHGRVTFFVYSNKESNQRKCRPLRSPSINNIEGPVVAINLQGRCATRKKRSDMLAENPLQINRSSVSARGGVKKLVNQKQNIRRNARWLLLPTALGASKGRDTFDIQLHVIVRRRGASKGYQPG